MDQTKRLNFAWGNARPIHVQGRRLWWKKTARANACLLRHHPVPRMTSIDPTICPVCGNVNRCAMEIAKATGQPVGRCWCVDAVFDPSALEKIPQSARGVACVCAACASGTNPRLNPKVG